MKRPLGIAMLLVLAASSLAWSARETGDFKKANQAYREGRFAEALSMYKKLASESPETGVFLYNWGDAAFRAGKLGEAVLAFERARLAEPRNGDILHNLWYARDQAGYRIKDTRNWYLKAAEAFLKYFSEGELAAAALLFYALLIGGWAFVIWTGREAGWGWMRKTALVLFLSAGGLVLGKGVQTHWIRDAIVMTNEALVRYGPSETDQVAFRLGEGLKIYVVEQREDWSRVILTNGGSGWIQNGEIELVRP